MVSPTIIDTLRAKQVELTTRIDAIEKDFQKGRSADFAEQTTECENDQVLDEIRQEAKTELLQVKRALERVHKDEYGACTKCGESIAAARLKTLPYTDFCVKCAL
ncbi:TraR/DksA family transcriptional regulator [Thalassotalea euphylliae]|uniref:TraR/DksA family transcriptional regulator n=1 Tax=Thalassotalea euphylliae TaxID=1655234 RepID=UPI00363CC0B3